MTVLRAILPPSSPAAKNPSIFKTQFVFRFANQQTLGHYRKNRTDFTAKGKCFRKLNAPFFSFLRFFPPFFLSNQTFLFCCGFKRGISMTESDCKLRNASLESCLISVVLSVLYVTYLKNIFLICTKSPVPEQQ